MSHVTEPEQ